MAKHDPEYEHEHIGIPGYLGVFGILVVGTILTYIVALQDLCAAILRKSASPFSSPLYVTIAANQSVSPASSPSLPVQRASSGW